MKNFQENWLLYLIILILAILYFTKEDGSIKEDKKELKETRDSTYTIKHEREVIKEQTKLNIQNIFNEKEKDNIFYTQSDSFRLHFIDSFMRYKGAR